MTTVDRLNEMKRAEVQWLRYDHRLATALTGIDDMFNGRAPKPDFKTRADKRADHLRRREQAAHLKLQGNLKPGVMEALDEEWGQL